MYVHIYTEHTYDTSPADNGKGARFQEILSRLRTDHLNMEEKANLFAICKEYSDIFYLEKKPLTFINKIKHKINIKYWRNTRAQ